MKNYKHINGLFKTLADGQGPTVPNVDAHRLFEIDSAIPIVVSFSKPSQKEETPLYAQRLSKQSGSWEWIVDNKRLAEALEFGDEVDEARFNKSVGLFIERREKQVAESLNPDQTAEPTGHK